MSRIKTPAEKKRLSLQRDHRVFTLEGNKSFRSAWRAKKAKANRRFRQAAAAELAKGTGLADDQGQSGAVTPSKRLLKKIGVMTLEQSIAVKKSPAGLRWSMGVLNKKPPVRIIKIRGGAEKKLKV